jgi:hypothetical protein
MDCPFNFSKAFIPPGTILSMSDLYLLKRSEREVLFAEIWERRVFWIFVDSVVRRFFRSAIFV